MEVVAEAGDGAEAVERALEQDVDLAILDVTMPRLTGIQAARELGQRRPDLRVLILSMHDNERYFFEALRAGASGYVLKSVADRDLVEACRATMRGESFIYPGAVTALIRDYLERARQGERPREDPLSPRESEIVKLIAEVDEQRNGGQTISQTEYYVDVPPWRGGTATLMTAADGAFNSTHETATAVLPSFRGRHLVYVRARDFDGNWGVVRAVWVNGDLAPQLWLPMLP
jgi:CheY-like chemotaxis protein